VDDNGTRPAGMGMLLPLMGHEIRTAQDGFAAARIAGQFRPKQCGIVTMNRRTLINNRLFEPRIAPH